MPRCDMETSCRLQHMWQAYNLYKERDSENGWESSLTAKAAMTLSNSVETDVHHNLANILEY